MSATVDESKEQRMTGRREFDKPPNAERQRDVVVEEIFCDAIVSLSKHENVNFGEEREVVQEIPPGEFDDSVCPWRWI